jgi:hypothetical protein
MVFYLGLDRCNPHRVVCFQKPEPGIIVCSAEKIVIKGVLGSLLYRSMRFDPIIIIIILLRRRGRRCCGHRTPFSHPARRSASPNIVKTSYSPACYRSIVGLLLGCLSGTLSCPDEEVRTGDLDASRFVDGSNLKHSSMNC